LLKYALPETVVNRPNGYVFVYLFVLLCLWGGTNVVEQELTKHNKANNNYYYYNDGKVLLIIVKKQVVMFRSMKTNNELNLLGCLLHIE
jgi:hypothetical protein